MRKQENQNSKDMAKSKGYPIGSLVIATLVFIMVMLIININKTFEYHAAVKQIRDYKKEMKDLEYEKKILTSEITSYKSPRRILEVGLQSGQLKGRKENNSEDDIIYIKVNRK